MKNFISTVKSIGAIILMILIIILCFVLMFAQPIAYLKYIFS